MSSAILLVAIVAIWACALVPKWVRRSQDAGSEARLPADDDMSGQEDGYHAEAGYPEGAAYETAGAYEPADPYEDAYEDEDSYEDAYEDEAAYGDEAAYADEAVSGSNDEAEPSRRAGLTAHAHVDPGGHAGPGMLVGHVAPDDAYQAAQETPDRERVLRTRRTMLIALILLFAATLGAAVLSIAHWWLVLPSASMLLGYLMLLRAAVRADAENAARRAASRARAAAFAARSARAAATAQERARAAAVASAPQPTAEVISIGDLTAQASDPDEPYDQYTDATARAIGD